MEEKIRQLHRMLEEKIITPQEFETMKKEIFSQEKESTLENKQKVTINTIGTSKVKAKSHWKFILSAFVIIFILIIGTTLVIRNNNLKAKINLAQQLTSQTNYTVTYKKSVDAFEYVADNNIEDEISENVDEYVSENQVSTDFIKEWRSKVIPDLKYTSQQDNAKGSKLIIVNPENHNRSLLVIKNGKIITDAFSDITYDYDN